MDVLLCSVLADDENQDVGTEPGRDENAHLQVPLGVRLRAWRNVRRSPPLTEPAPRGIPQAVRRGRRRGRQPRGAFEVASQPKQPRGLEELRVARCRPTSAKPCFSSARRVSPTRRRLRSARARLGRSRVGSIVPARGSGKTPLHRQRRRVRPESHDAGRSDCGGCG